MAFREQESDKKNTAKTGTKDERGLPVSVPGRRLPGFGPDKNTGKSPTVIPKPR